MVSPVTIFLNVDASIINSSEISSPIFASFPKSITVENLSSSFFKSNEEIFRFPSMFFNMFKYVDLPFEPVPVRMNALPSSFLLNKQNPAASSSNFLIWSSPQAILLSVWSVFCEYACGLKSQSILFVITISGERGIKLQSFILYTPFLNAIIEASVEGVFSRIIMSR
ncbi:hypothetical protein SDC9_169190 [bioreactor metagenome]|uniref:Uncharacterized protein n=1 Tax=bioreactor metagenome TaxID=1076179 RepID=A0A645G4M4_9ZZZZ